MKIPSKKTEEQLAAERNILAVGYNSDFWKLFKNLLQEEIDATYRAFPAYKTWDEVKYRQGYLDGLLKAQGLDTNFKR